MKEKKDPVQELLDALPRPTQEQLAMLNEHGDLMPKLSDWESLTEERKEILSQIREKQEQARYTNRIPVPRYIEQYAVNTWQANYLDKIMQAADNTSVVPEWENVGKELGKGYQQKIRIISAQD